MRIYAVVPIQEAFHINLVANLQILYCCVNISGVIAQIGFNSEGVCISV